MEEEQDEIFNSPIEQVRLTVPTTDDKTMPVLTFRAWVLGLGTAIPLCFINEFFRYRQNPLFFPSSIVILLLLPVGRMMAATLPKKPVRVLGTSWEISMNPGPFNIKEHIMISYLVGPADSSPFALEIVPQMKAFFHRRINPMAVFLLMHTTQMIGYGFAGLFMKFLVDSAYMWWPLNLPSVTYYRSLHEAEVRPKGQLTRLQFFFITFVVAFAYYVVPSYYFPSISSISLVCLIWKKSVFAQQIGSGLRGLGLGSFGLDWATVAGFLGSPLVLPITTTLNIMAGFILILYIITPIAYWTNAYKAKQFPIFSSDLFDVNGKHYNISRIIDDKSFQLDLEGYNNYSPVYMSVLMPYTYGFGYASVASTLVHVALNHGRSIWSQLKKAYGNGDQVEDIHTKLMKKNYDSIPQWWFYSIIISMVGLAIFTVEGFNKQLQLPFWGVFLACALGVLFILPFGTIIATTGVGTGLFVNRLLIGYLYPGKPIASLVFRAYSGLCLYTAIAFLENFKFGHYMKIPPKSMFLVQIVSTIVTSSIQFATTWWMFSTIKGICDPSKLPKGSQWTCPGENVFNNQFISWGLVGPARIFAPWGVYSKMYLFFLIGPLATILVWLLTRWFPNKKWIRLINVPIIFVAAIGMPTTKAVHFWSWFVVGFSFNYIVYNNHKEWWAKYNYILSMALDSGNAFMAILSSISLNLQDIYGVNWWGQVVGDHCPLATCPTAPGIQIDGCPIVH